MKRLVRDSRLPGAGAASPAAVFALLVLLIVPVREGRTQATGPLVAVDVAQAPLGLFSSAAAAAIVAGGGGRAPGLTVVQGDLEVVDHLGQRMLRASSRSTLLLTLPATLPTDFSVAIDLVPKECCQPEDVAIEGTRAINQGPNSARLLWRREDFRVIGGGPTYDQKMPEDLAAATPGALTNIVFSFQGDELTVYTNGRVVHALPGRKFVRGPVLQVFLGGQNDTDRAVYLAGLRVVAGASVATTSSSAALSGGSIAGQNIGGTITAAGSNPAPGTVAGAPPPVPTNVPANPGVTAGPLTPGQTRPLSAGQTSATSNATGSSTATTTIPARSVTLTGFAATGALATLTPRVVALSGFSATGVSGLTTGPSGTLNPRTLAMSGFSATGVSTALTPRTLALSGFSATGVSTRLNPRMLAMSGFFAAGVFGALPPRSVALPGFSGTGVASSLAARTVSLPAFRGTGAFASLAPRTLTLPGLAAAGTNVALTPRTLSLSGFAASGDFPSLLPRTVALSAFWGAGSFITLPPRSITLQGWSATGVP